VESGEKMQKDDAKKMKHQTSGKIKSTKASAKKSLG